MQEKIAWQAHEFRHYPKNTGWYIIFISVAVLMIGFFAIVKKDIFAAISMAIFGIFIFFFSRQTPQVVNIELNGKGIKFGQLFYPYKQIKYFWVVHNDHHQTVNFHTTALLNNTVILELHDQDPEEIRQFLLRHLPEHHETEATVVQKIMHRFKF